MDKIVIVGGGLVGSAMAIYLSRRGYQVEIFERHADPRGHYGVKIKPSINITLCERGLRALARIDLKETVLALTVPLTGRRVHGIDGRSSYLPYGNNGEQIYSISRAELNETMITAAEKCPGVTFHFNKRCTHLDLATTTLRFEDRLTGELSTIKAKRIFGTDGAHSTIRMHLQRTDLFNYQQEYWTQGYKELILPARPDGSWALQGDAFHVWPRSDHMLIGFPNRDGTCTCALHMSFHGKHSHESITTEATLREFMHASFPDVADEFPDLAAQFFAMPANSMVTVRCNPWSYNDSVVLVGDAAHAILPSYGQGANAGFEDCATLDDCMSEHGDDWQMVFREYERRRRGSMDVISRLCVEHFLALRDSFTDSSHLLKVDIERRINELCPDLYKSLYSMIAFTYQSYSEAYQAELRQRALLERLVKMEDIARKICEKEFEPILLQHIQTWAAESPVSRKA